MSEYAHWDWTEDKGRGVFASRSIPKGTVFEEAAVIITKVRGVSEALQTTNLWEYVYDWDGKRAAIALGLGSLFNHSDEPNVEYQYTEEETIQYRTTRSVKKGEELLINYGSIWWE